MNVDKSRLRIIGVDIRGVPEGRQRLVGLLVARVVGAVGSVCCREEAAHRE